MSPYERIARLYEEDLSPPGAFDILVEWHLQQGFVFSTPEYFVMGRPVISAASADLICEPTMIFPEGRCDCWYIHAMAGNLAKVWDILPIQLPWIGWQRHNDPEKVLRIYPLARMRSMSQYHDASTY